MSTPILDDLNICLHSAITSIKNKLNQSFNTYILREGDNLIHFNLYRTENHSRFKKDPIHTSKNDENDLI